MPCSILELWRAALHIAVTTKDKKELRGLLSGGAQQVRVVLQAVALLQLARGVSAPKIAGMVPVTAQAIPKDPPSLPRRPIGTGALREAAAGAEALLEDSQKQRISAMVLLRSTRGVRPVDSAVGGPSSRQKRRLVPMGTETIRIPSQPRPQAVAEKNVVRGRAEGRVLSPKSRAFWKSMNMIHTSRWSV